MTSDGGDIVDIWFQSKYNSMKKIVVTIALLSASMVGFSQSPIQSPCSDSLYVVLKTKNIALMSEREFTYFNQKEKDCSEFRKALMQEEVKIETLNITKKTMNTYWTIAAIGVAISLIPLLLL
jgi:hypothetical protein